MDKESQASFLATRVSSDCGPVECLGITFATDAARREYFRDKLRQALDELDQHLGGVQFLSIDDTVSRLMLLKSWNMDPERARDLATRMALAGNGASDLLQRWKDVVGFPRGDYRAILELSDPPYYTACPNPFITSFLELYGTNCSGQCDDYVRAPLAVDVSEGKNDPLYRIPSYHTKVPPAAIQQYLLHYTKPGDVVLDAFCGTGMTGVAGLLLATKDGRPNWGPRHVILCDLSPAATFTASIMNAPLHSGLQGGAQGRLANFVREHITPLYASDFGGDDGTFDYAVWSEWGACDECGTSFLLFDVVVDWGKSEILSNYSCPTCNTLISGRRQRRDFTTEFDHWIDRPVRVARTSLVLLSQRQGNRAVRKEANSADVELAEQIGARPVRLLPVELPYSHMTHERNNLPEYWGITHVHHFYTRRNYYALDKLATIPDPELRRAALFAVLTILDNNATRRNRFYVDKRRPNGSPIGPLSNTLYVPSLQVEANIGKKVLRLLDDIAKIKERWPNGRAIVSTQSATALWAIPDNSVDFVFTDPPFGGNINYSEQNFLAEWWLQVFTNNREEAITNPVQRKGIPEYHEIMRRCFREYYRVVKPGRWMVVEFHNSSNAIWIAIQRALEEAGWVVGAVNVLDKVHSTLHQDHKPAAVNKDLAIAVYKPAEDLADKFQLLAGQEEGVWEFVTSHLRQLPVLLGGGSAMGIVPDRQATMLYDRMVAFHVSRGITVPMSAGDFYIGLAQRFPERDGMYFLPEQVADYDRRRASIAELRQLDLFVSDEASAIQWVRQQLQAKPQTFQDLQPTFMKELQAWAKHERTIELKEILEQNFLRYDGKGPVPSQIHSYLSSNYKSLRGLDKEDPRLVEEARDRWYVPDPAKQGDLEKLREKALLREFEEYRNTKQRKLKVFRTEAVRAGFKAAYEARDYRTIVDVAAKLPESVLQEDEKLLMYYDVATMRLGE